MPDATETKATEEASSGGKGKSASGSPSKGGSNNSSKLLLGAVGVLAVVIVALGAVVMLRGSGGPSYSDQQVADAKTSVCKSSLAATKSVVRNTHLKNPAPDNNPIGSLAVAANARLALSGGGSYLHDRLSAEPATPDELHDAVEKLATTFEGLGISYMAGESNDAREPLRKDLDDQIKQVNELCK